MKTHNYSCHLNWTGQGESGTASYGSYQRTYEVSVPGKQTFNGSADPAFRGDPTLHNPEELLLMALSSCHMLWYLHLCADAGVVVTDYQDRAEGIMEEDPDGSGRFTEVVLRPKVVIDPSSDPDIARELHSKANSMCFIANSCNFPVRHVASIKKKN